ncbi:hypothetical protein V8J88_14390 [Massilia sp. W12]|uniref:hypothetical protein n=1 Tax=Massilia sp. W12 TaxID=3126507 RepID=UPI0030CDE361
MTKHRSLTKLTGVSGLRQRLQNCAKLRAVCAVRLTPNPVFTAQQAGSTVSLSFVEEMPVMQKIGYFCPDARRVKRSAAAGAARRDQIKLIDARQTCRIYRFILPDLEIYYG